MLATGDWLVPTFGGLPRLEKPPLPYWAIAATGFLFGEVNEWTARLPAACAALGLALLAGCWASRWYGPVAGYATALVQVTSLYAITFGRKAEVDMLLWLCMTAALFLVVHQPPAEPRVRAFLRWFGVYALLAVAWLAKFHYGPVLVLAPVIAAAILERRWTVFRQLANPAGLSIFAAAVLIWPWLVVERVPAAWEVWRHETLGRALGELGSQPVWYYLPHVASLAPTRSSRAALPRAALPRTVSVDLVLHTVCDREPGGGQAQALRRAGAPRAVAAGRPADRGVG
jgi:4-amino-4-deoxy-L-arabinose transferase-like glycosyltransferase